MTEPDAQPDDGRPAPVSEELTLPSRADVEKAAERISGLVRRTPVLTCASIDRWCGAEVFMKAEHLQRTGAFKARGATNAVWSLDDATAARGVAAHSSGNHAAALALAAATRGIPCWVVMPRDAPRAKVAATRSYGADITFCDPTPTSREETLAGVLERTGATEIHPYDDPTVIAGAATAALELLEQVTDLDDVVVPIGGGGLFSGTAVAVRSASETTKVWAAEPEGADDAARSLEAGELLAPGRLDTIADGLLTGLSPRTFRALGELGSGVLRVADAATIEAMGMLWTRAKQVVEPSGAVALAALAGGSFRGRRVGVVLSGGNLDPGRACDLLAGVDGAGRLLHRARARQTGAMTTHPSPTDATVDKCLDLGHGFHEDERDKVVEILQKLDHRFHGTEEDRVQLVLMVKDRDHNDQKVTFEAYVAGVPAIVATAEDEDLWAAVAHVREEFLRQYNDWRDAHRR